VIPLAIHSNAFLVIPVGKKNRWVYLLRVRAKINSQILSVEAPAGQGAKVQEYQAYSELSQRRPAGCIGA
jgi:hypothetical protein